MIQGRRAKTKLLFYYGLALIGIGLTLGGPTFFDLTTILITGNNMDGLLKIYIMWVPTAVLAGPLMAYVWSEIIIPKKKWYFLSIVLILNMLILLDLFIFHWMTPIIIPPAIPGEGLVEVYYGLLIPTQRLPARWSLFVNSYGLVFGAGVLYKAFKVKGIFRKKYIYLSINIVFHCLSRILMFQMIQAFGGGVKFIFIIIDTATLVFAYLGLRAEPEERKKKVKKKIIAKDSFFRIVERPEHISEEEVAYYREQKICLVCKGKVEGFNIFLCPNCEALYHEDCARALTEMENSCWVCIDPIDESKPTKPFKKVEGKKKNNKKSSHLKR
ncbi:MAG: hypothetical protein JSV62_02410 [Promethearchaeota archaeon]|nr:MAG: hypothetical protein JSV62_02410 [Candidatus Lokiarchaeota archaeon]